MFSRLLLAIVVSCTTLVSSHYTFPSLLINGASTGDWVNVRRTNNYNSNSPIQDVSSPDFRCYNSQGSATSSTATVAAGSRVGFQANQAVYHPSVTNVYMAKAPGNVSTWDGSGNVWFKVHEVSASTNGGTQMTFPAQNANNVQFTLPKNLPTGQYLVRVENIALHGAATFGGAQFYISCGQVSVTGGGSGNPGPLVAIPGVYTGREPGIMLNIYYPVPASYKNPGPAVWTG